MKKLFLLPFCFLLILISCKKNSEPTLQLVDQLSDSQLQILDAAPTDNTTRFSDVLFADGSNISNWSLANDSGYVFTFSKSSSIIDASDKKNLFISRMTKAGLILADDNQCSCYPTQPNGLAYVYGSKRINTTHIDPIAICKQPFFGLDCSGMIYLMAKASSLNLLESGTVDYIEPTVWNSAFNNSTDFQGLEMKDLSILPASQFQAGDIIVAANVHMGMVYGTGTTLGIMNSQGSYKKTCAENSQSGRGPILKSNIQSWLTSLFPNNNYHVLRVVLNGPPGITTNSISSISQTSANSGGKVTNEGSSSVTERGVCWSTTQNPTITNQKTTNGSGMGLFSSSITGLIANTTYYVRAYATNAAGTGYGSQVAFTTPANSYITISNPSIYPILMTPYIDNMCYATEKCDFSCNQNNWDGTLNKPKFVDANGVTQYVNGVLMQNVTSTWDAASNFISSGNGVSAIATSFTNITTANGIVSGKVNIVCGDAGHCPAPHTDLLSTFNFTLIYSTLGNTIFNTNLNGTYQIGSNTLYAHQ